MSVWLPVPQGNHEMTQPNKMMLLSLKIDCCDEAYADQFLMTVFLAQGYHPCSVFFFSVDWRLKFLFFMRSIICLAFSCRCCEI